MLSLAEKLRAIRKAKGMSQKEVADKLGVAQVNYSKIETGKTSITIDKLSSLAEIYEVPITHFLQGNLESNCKKEKEEIEFLNFKIGTLEKEKEALQLAKDYLELKIETQVLQFTEKETRLQQLESAMNLLQSFPIIDFSKHFSKLIEIVKDEFEKGVIENLDIARMYEDTKMKEALKGNEGMAIILLVMFDDIRFLIKEGIIKDDALSELYKMLQDMKYEKFLKKTR